MKHTKLFLAALAALIAGSCSTPVPKTRCVSLVFDTTDHLPAVHVAEVSDLHRLIPLGKDATTGARLRISTVGEVRNAPGYIVEAAAHARGESNDFARVDECKAFFADAEAALEKAKATDRMSTRSYVTHAVISAMDDLAGCTACTDRKAVFISDLSEHSDLFSTYGTKAMQTLEKQPQRFLEKIEAAYPHTKPYQGIEVWFVHWATPENDKRFGLMAELLTGYLTDRGATVHPPVGSLDEVH